VWAELDDDWCDSGVTPQVPQTSDSAPTVEPPRPQRLKRELKGLLNDSGSTPQILPSRTRSAAKDSVRLATDTSCGFAEVQTAYLAVPGPKTYEDAEASEEAEEWMGAIASEQASLRQHDVYEFVEKAPGKVVDGKWVMVLKQHPDGTIEKYKVRLVARGDMQSAEEYSEISSPVVDAEVVRLTLSEAARNDLEIAVLDVPTAYLGATLQEEVYLRLPTAVWADDPWKRKRPLVRLKKSVPGLKQSGKCWFDDISAFVTAGQDTRGAQGTRAEARAKTEVR
jgi:hypothetical protein